MEEKPVELGTEGIELKSQKQDSFSVQKSDVNSWDIFLLAKWILAVSASIYLILGLIRIYFPGVKLADGTYDNEGIKEVWEYSKVFLNSIISLVLGLYFGAKAESQKNR